MCIDYYCTLLEKLEERTGVSPNNTDGKCYRNSVVRTCTDNYLLIVIIPAADFKTDGLKWLKDVYYQCFIHLGDLGECVFEF